MAQRTSVSSCQVWSHKRTTRRERLAFSIALCTSIPMAGRARSPRSIVINTFRGGASDASPALPRSSQATIERKDLHGVAFSTRRRGTARGPQPWQRDTRYVRRLSVTHATPAGADRTIAPERWRSRLARGLLLAPARHTWRPDGAVRMGTRHCTYQ